ncbi:MotE family protein [Halothermothrix orenii]|uniref:Uncharacterized conserved protein n=1 Tax=Halothermothrix orenii (strain H 168 / OCM 544 / DSM 9562) TaxID=373903 RepID=B8CYR5_HALOH|nr:hypothetical protein [Halothermothrix orenii]ACL70434.1 uncharacterized conserved protein [Halothermothrix orenii H 168]
MKKLLYTLLIIVFLGAVLFGLNYFEIISLKAWGEKVLTSAPVLEEYYKTDQAFDNLFNSWENIREENIQLSAEVNRLNKELKSLKEIADERALAISNLQEELTKLSKDKLNHQEKVNKLVKIYSEMDPEEAARIVDSLDRELTLEILTNMKEDIVAEILVNLEPDKAAELTRQLQE